jgi:hypothetical protein
MQTRPWDRETDYDTLVKWWNQHEFGVVPREVLPPDGIIGTEFAFMEWIVADKNANKRQLHKALKLCVDALFELAKDEGMQLVFTTTSASALQKRYIKYHGMNLTENHVKTFLKDLTKDERYASKSLDWISDDTQISIQRIDNK